MRLIAIVLLATVVTACVAFSEIKESELSAMVVRSGIFTNREGCRQTKDQHLAAGYMTSCDYGGFEDRHTVEKSSGVAFGFDYLVRGMAEGKCYLLTHQVDHPKFSPYGREPISTQRRTFKVCGTGSNRGTYADDYLWAFDEEWEKVPGQWVLSLLHEEDVLLKEEFIIY